MTASLQNEVSWARSQTQEVAALREQLKKATEDTAKAKLELKAAQINNVFSVGNHLSHWFEQSEDRRQS